MHLRVNLLLYYLLSIEWKRMNSNARITGKKPAKYYLEIIDVANWDRTCRLTKD
jgi:hypothetical protein